MEVGQLLTFSSVSESLILLSDWIKPQEHYSSQGGHALQYHVTWGHVLMACLVVNSVVLLLRSPIPLGVW